ncbi:hypothetical protein BGZ59_001645 [Podila verticillata]|uniref:Ribosome receptor lysine/proline rich domain-containing protein n=1 Tax=Podila verticillata NRRL 6337 TaxID=1069443 RepID=A0A086TKH6_9FUNG|nr:hypothetical protein BGZ59_001645 [Podila verticillata]KFH62453.1 hypothetical protein MVEG_11662 [Podila verticillata NRRL 6337]
MEYINATTVTLALLGASMGAYYVYVKVIEPHNRRQRAMLAEQAQKELLIAHENMLLKRGSNKKQAKKKPILATRPKKQDSDKDDGPQEVDEHVSTSNPFDILDAPPSSKITKKEVKQMAKPTAAEALVEVPVVATKAVKFSSAPETKSPKKKPKAVLVSTLTQPAPVPTPLQTPVAEIEIKTQPDEELKFVVRKSRKGSLSRNFDVEPTSAPEPFKFVKASEPKAITIPVQGKFKPAKESKNQPKPVEDPVPAEIVVDTPQVPEHSVPTHEYEALQALLKARELALAAADARAERTKSQIQELQRQLDTNAELVKPAKRSQTRSQNIESKIESLHYTNSLLINQLSLEKETSKETQVLMLKASKMVQELETKVQELEQERSHISGQVDQMAELNRELQQQRSQSENEAAQLLQSLDDAERRVDVALKERNEHHQKLSLVLTEKDGRISALEAEIDAMEGELEGLRLQMESYTEAMGHAEDMSQSRDEAFKGEKQSLLEEIDMLRAQLTQESIKISEKETEVRKVQAELEEVRRELTETQVRHKEIIAKHEEHLIVLSTKEQELTSAHAHAKSLTAQMSEIQKAQSGLVQTRQQQFEHLTKELEQSNSQINALIEKQETLTRQIVDLTTKSTEHTNTAHEQALLLQKRIEELTTRVEVKDSTHKVVLGEKEGLMAQLATIQAAHDTVRREHEQLVKERQELSTVAEAKTKEVETMIRDKERLALEFSQKYEWTSSLVKEKETLVATEAKKSLELQNMTKEKETLSKEKSELAAEKVLLAVQLVAALEAKKLADAELKVLIEANNAKTAEHGALSARVVELEWELEQGQRQKQSESKDVEVLSQEETAVVAVVEKKVEELLITTTVTTSEA